MPFTVTHSAVVSVPDDGTSPVGSDEWNAGHVVSGGILVTDLPSGSAGSVLYTDGTSALWTSSPSISGTFTAPTLVTSGATVSGGLVVGPGSTALAPLRVAAGTNLTTASAGAVEYDGNELFFSPAASDRRSLICEAFIRQHAIYTLTSTASVQKLFNGSANGAMTLPVGSYYFECVTSLSAMSATSGNAAFSIASGTGTATNFLWNWSAIDDTTGAVQAWQTGMAVTSATPASMATAGTNTTLQFVARGTFEVSVAGTFIPSIQLVTAATAVVAVGSFFRCHRLGATTDVAIGNWS